MANKRRDNSAGTKIRHHVFALMRKHGTTQIKLASSYELGEMFGTTRRVARYELEQLISQGYLISKPRVGTFTNPLKNYINMTPVQKKMPLIGIIEGDGDRFCYGCAENLIYCNMGLSLSKYKCYVHHINFSCTDAESRLKELKTLGLDGILWHTLNPFGFPTKDFFKEVEKAGIPVVAISHTAIDYCHSIVLSTAEVEDKLAGIFKEEQRKTVLVISNMGQETKIAERVMHKMKLDTNSLKSFEPDSPFPEKMTQLQELIDHEDCPDIIFCDAMAAETVPEILTSNGIDIANQCRLVACNHLNSEEEFQGYIIAPDVKKATDAAAEMLIKIKDGNNNSISVTEISCQLKEITH